MQDIPIHRFSNHHFQQKSKSLPKQRCFFMVLASFPKKHIKQKTNHDSESYLDIEKASLITYSDSVSSGGGGEVRASKQRNFQVAGHWLQSLVNSMVGDSSGTLEMWRIFSNLDGGWLGCFKRRCVVWVEWRWRCRKVRKKNAKREIRFVVFYMSNVVIEYDMICIHVCILLRYMYIYVHTYVTSCWSECIIIWNDKVVYDLCGKHMYCIQWMRMMMACM